MNKYLIFATALISTSALACGGGYKSEDKMKDTSAQQASVQSSQSIMPSNTLKQQALNEQLNSKPAAGQDLTLSGQATN